MTPTAEEAGGGVRSCEGGIPIPVPPLPVAGTHASLVVADASENWLGLEGEAAAEPGAGGRALPPEMPALALLLLELLAESCFFLELLNFTLPESVSFNFSNSLLIGLSMMKDVSVTDYCAEIQCGIYSRTKTFKSTYSFQLTNSV